MRKVSTGTELLEWLRVCLGRNYISDLRLFARGPTAAALRLVLAPVRPEDWPLEMWKDAVHYLTDEVRPFSSQQEAADYLAAYAEGR